MITTRKIVFTALAGALSLSGTPAFAQMSVNSRLSISGSCSSCDLSRRDMTRLSLNGSNFSNSNFSRSNLSGGELNKSNLTGAQFSRAYLVRTKGEGVNMRRAILSDATMTEAALNRSDFSEADLRRADLTKGEFKGSDFSQTHFSNAEASGANFTDAKFSLAKLHHTNFENATFIAAKLKFTEFGTANVAGADFTAADFSGADMRRVRGLTQKQLDQGCGNPDTQLPEGLNVPYCPEYMQVVSTGQPHVHTRTRRSLIINGEDVGYKLDQLDITKSGLAENINTLERALNALPRKGSQAARAELEMSKKHLQTLHDAL